LNYYWVFNSIYTVCSEEMFFWNSNLENEIKTIIKFVSRLLLIIFNESHEKIWRIYNELKHCSINSCYSWLTLSCKRVSIVPEIQDCFQHIRVTPLFHLILIFYLNSLSLSLSLSLPSLSSLSLFSISFSSHLFEWIHLSIS
jgi:hypothetical protein